MSSYFFHFVGSIEPATSMLLEGPTTIVLRFLRGSLDGAQVPTTLRSVASYRQLLARFPNVPMLGFLDLLQIRNVEFRMRGKLHIQERLLMQSQQVETMARLDFGGSNTVLSMLKRKER